MNNQVLRLTASLALLAFPGLLQAQTAGGKLGVLNLQEAIQNTGEGKKVFAEIQKKYTPRQQDLQRQQQEINALQDQLQRQAATLSDEERVRLTRELEDKQKIFKRATEDANADYNADTQDAFRRIGQKMVRIVNEYAQQNGFALIIDDAQLPVYYVAQEIDLTEEMVRRYDAAHPVEAASAPAPPGGSGAAARPAATTTNPPKP
jgi:outer membrane protein